MRNKLFNALISTVLHATQGWRLRLFEELEYKTYLSEKFSFCHEVPMAMQLERNLFSRIRN